MECIPGGGGSYQPEWWRASPLMKPSVSTAPQSVEQTARAPVDFLNSFGMSPLDLEPLSNIISFATCTPSYKEFSVFAKEKGDIADALLSLKHAVVHPGMAPAPVSGSHHQLSPLSPLSPSSHGHHHHHHHHPGHQYHQSPNQQPQVPPIHPPGPPPPAPPPPPPSSAQMTPGGSAAAAAAAAASLASPGHPAGPHPTFSYTVNHQPQMMQGYSPMSSQYHTVPSHGQYSDHVHPGQGSPPSHSQTNMFPSMSVNVSMSMNVGMPPGMGGQCGMGQTDQWMTPQQHTPQPHHSHSQYQPCASPYQHHPQPYSQYNTGGGIPGGNNANQYSASYTFSPELRNCSSKEAIFGKPNTDAGLYKDQSRSLYSPMSSLSPQKRSKLGSPPSCHSRHSQVQETSKLNLCRICGKTYARPSTLKTHLRTHSGEKPYRCSTCGKSFSQAANLTAHLRTHSGEKPFRCPVCERRFSQSSSVTTHMRTHSGERPYRCRLCKKAFSDSSTLTKHLRIHSGEKPYQCKLCLLRFSQSGNLNRHMRVHATSA